MQIILVIVAAAVIALGVAGYARSASFARQIEQARRRLIALQTSPPPDQSAIPQLIRTFAARCGARQSGPPTIVLLQSAQMKLGAGQPFLPIHATQISGTRDPGFVWYAQGKMAGFVPMAVVDSCVDGAGWLEARLAGSIVVARATGPDVSRGEAMRFLAELPWNPDALLNANGLEWRQLDDRTVEVGLPVPAGPAHVRLIFDAAGDIVRVEADDRPMAVGKASLPTKWVGRFSDYVAFGPYRLPRHGEVAWVLADGEFLYWRGDIVGVNAVLP